MDRTEPASHPKVAMENPGNMQKAPDNWVTGDEPMTGAQASYLKTLCEETGEAFDQTLTKARASELIDALRARDPRITSQKPRR